VRVAANKKVSEWHHARTLPALADKLNIPNLCELTHHFLFGQCHPDDPRDAFKIPLAECPQFDGRITVYNSACSRFYALSDLSGISGMQTEIIQSMPLWRKKGSRHDCVFITTNPDAAGLHAFDIVRVLSFFSFTNRNRKYFPCAVIRWFDKLGDSADKKTGMWMVWPSFLPNHSSNHAVIHMDSIYCAAHLIPVYGAASISSHIKPHNCYDSFHTFYVNKYVDHHSFELAS